MFICPEPMKQGILWEQSVSSLKGTLKIFQFDMFNWCLMGDGGGSGGGDNNKKEEENNCWSSYVSPTMLSALFKFSHLLTEEVKFQKGKQLS